MTQLRKNTRTPRTVYPFHHKAVKDSPSEFDNQSKNTQESAMRYYYEQYQYQRNSLYRKQWFKNNHRFN